MDWEALARIDWLKHQWAFTVAHRALGGSGYWEVLADGVGVGSFRSEADARRWMQEARPCCLAELIARQPTLHPAEAIIDAGGSRRLGRIRPELWGAYDALPVTRTDNRITVLSAKARAAFPSETAVFVRVRRYNA